MNISIFFSSLGNQSYEYTIALQHLSLAKYQHFVSRPPYDTILNTMGTQYLSCKSFLFLLNSNFTRSITSLYCGISEFHSILFHTFDRYHLHRLLRMQASSRSADVGKETQIQTHLKLVINRQLVVLIARFVRFLALKTCDMYLSK